MVSCFNHFRENCVCAKKIKQKKASTIYQAMHNIARKIKAPFHNCLVYSKETQPQMKARRITGKRLAFQNRWDRADGKPFMECTSCKAASHCIVGTF